MLMLMLTPVALAEKSRANKLFEQVRCPSCVAQTVADSNTLEAKNIRVFIQEKLAQGKQESEILNQVAAIYGEKVLMQSNISNSTIALWIAPVLIFLLFMILGLRKRFG